MPTVAGNGTLFRGAADVVFRPNEFTGAITSTWATVPYCTTDFGTYSDKTVDHLVTVHNPTTGIGDICRYMGVVDGAHWRMPTAAEIAELYGSDQANKGQAVILGNGWVQGNYYPLSGYAMGPMRNSVKITGSGTDALVTNTDPNIDGAVFLPASGFRDPPTGAIYNIGTAGHYWSSTASRSTHGHYMEFDSSSVTPQQSWNRTAARSIRCIRE